MTCSRRDVLIGGAALAGAGLTPAWGGPALAQAAAPTFKPLFCAEAAGDRATMGNRNNREVNSETGGFDMCSSAMNGY